ncbi:MAG: hypothetical protein RL375_2003 [Pseudomonadota bacterium]|jgi:hypothetical protein
MSSVDLMMARLVATPTRASLRRRGLLAVLLLTVYLVGTAGYGMLERSRLHHGIQAILTVTDHERELSLTEAAVHTTLLEAIEAAQHPGGGPGADAYAEMTLYMQSCARLFERLQGYDPAYVSLAQSLAASHAALTDHPDRVRWLALRDTLGKVSATLEAAHVRLSARRSQLLTSYEAQFDAVTFETVVLLLAGLTIFAVAAHGFLGRLVDEIGNIEHRVRVLAGASDALPDRSRVASQGPLAPWQRSAELGALDAAVDLLGSGHTDSRR